MRPSAAQAPSVRSTDHFAAKISRQATPVMATAGIETLRRHRELGVHEAEAPRSGLGEQGVGGEVDGEVGDDADDSGGDAGQGCGQGLVVAEPFDGWCAEQHEQEAGYEGDPRGEQGGQGGGYPRVERARGSVGTDEGDELDDHDQRAGGGFGEGETPDHLPGQQPAVDVDGLLGDVGQHGVGTAEGDQGGAGEEQALVDEDAVPAERDTDSDDGNGPDGQSDGEDDAGATKAGSVGMEVVVADQAAAARRRRTSWRVGR